MIVGLDFLAVAILVAAVIYLDRRVARSVQADRDPVV
jgi:hypothetical protein